jgi:hypothetical protein
MNPKARVSQPALFGISGLLPTELRRTSEFRLEGFDAGEAGGELGGEGAGEFVFGEADGLVDISEGILGEDAVLGLAQDEADGGCIVLMAQEVIDGGTGSCRMLSL